MTSKRPFLKASACAAAAFVLLTAVLLTAGGVPADPSVALGHVVGTVAVPALVTALWERRSKPGWPLWRTIVTYVALLVIIAGLQAAGRGTAAAAEARPAVGATDV